MQEVTVSNVPSLKSLSLANNCIEVLAIENAPSLREVYAGPNNLSAEALNDIIETLPKVERGKAYIFGNPGSGECERGIAEAKGWNVLYVDICSDCGTELNEERYCKKCKDYV